MVRPLRSSRTRSSPNQFSLRPRQIGDRTVSRRSKPSSRTTLNGEQPYPWDLLQPQDVMSRHRGAKHRRRYELLGGISLLSPEYLLSVERWPFHSEPPDHYDLLSYLLDLSVSAVKLAYTIALTSRCPTVISKPSCSSVTLWEETAPVKLPTRHCPRPRFVIFVRTSNVKGVVFQGRLHNDWRHCFKGSHLSYTSKFNVQCQAIVKVHGVFPSSRGYTASSRRFQFH